MGVAGDARWRLLLLAARSLGGHDKEVVLVA
jgi:hypothetical protein